MNQQHLMRFTIRQMERERERSLQLKKKKDQSNCMMIKFKKLLINLKSKITFKGEINND